MILVTGSAGYIGSHITKKLDDLKIPYMGIDNLSYSKLANVSNKKKFILVDIGDEKKINKIFIKYKFKTVIHAAAYAYVLESEIKKKKYYINNVLNTKKFINSCINFKIKNFIFLSSSNVYRESKNKFSENNFVKPKNVYGKNKLTIENFLLKKKIYNLVILRLFNIIGLFKKFEPFKFKQNNFQRIFFSILNIKKIQKEFSLNFFFKNKKIYFPSRDFVDINDLINLINIINRKIDNNENVRGIYNVGSGISKPINYIIEQIEKIKKIKIKTKFTKIYRNEILHTCAKIDKVKRKFNWSPKIKLNNSISSTIKNLIIN